MYIVESREQSIFTQPDCKTYFAANFKECSKLKEPLTRLTELTLVDTSQVKSAKTKSFQDVSNQLFLDIWESLWMTSALRFFVLEDLMVANKWEEALHVEADNLLYGRLTSVLPNLRQNYPLAVTPLTHQLSFLTASVFWVSQLRYLRDFTDFMLSVATNQNNTRTGYIDFLRPFFSKKGGLYAGEDDMGVKLHSINEMSMLAYYRQLRPSMLRLLPIIPNYEYPFNKHFPNVSVFLAGGAVIGPATGVGLWDSGSYGQYLGGTHDKKGSNRRFTDPSHLAGLAVRVCWGQEAFFCSNFTECDYSPDSLRDHAACRCYSAPFFRCGGDQPWRPLWNLHAHSKQTDQFRSRPCDCQQSVSGRWRVEHYADPRRYLHRPEVSPF
jgi:hypothetical protein